MATDQEFPIWMTIAKKYLGTKEIPGPKANPTIKRMLESTNLGRPYNQSDETPWCSASVNLIMDEARDNDGRIPRPTYSAAAVSWATWGTELEYGQYGCIVVMDPPGKGHHIGFYYDEGEDENGNYGIRLLGGNQGNAQCIRWFPWDWIIAFRWPKSYPLEEV